MLWPDPATAAHELHALGYPAFRLEGKHLRGDVREDPFRRRPLPRLGIGTDGSAPVLADHGESGVDDADRGVHHRNRDDVGSEEGLKQLCEIDRRGSHRRKPPRFRRQAADAEPHGQARLGSGLQRRRAVGGRADHLESDQVDTRLGERGRLLAVAVEQLVALEAGAPSHHDVGASGDRHRARDRDRAISDAVPRLEGGLDGQPVRFDDSISEPGSRERHPDRRVRVRDDDVGTRPDVVLVDLANDGLVREVCDSAPGFVVHRHAPSLELGTHASVDDDDLARSEALAQAIGPTHLPISFPRALARGHA